MLIGKRAEKSPAVRVRLREFCKDHPAHAPVSLVQAARDEELDDPDRGPFGLQGTVEDLPDRRFLFI